MSDLHPPDFDAPSSPVVARALREAELLGAAGNPIQTVHRSSRGGGAKAAPASDDSSVASRPAAGAGDRNFTVPGYLIIAELHRGGQGVIYLAIQEATQRDVA